MQSVKDFIKATFEYTKASDRVVFRNRQQRRYDLYAGEYKQHIVKRLQTVCPMTWDQFTPLWINLYRKVIDRRAGVFYRTPPTRTFLNPDGSEVAPEVKARVEKILPPREFSGVMDKVARYLESHRTIAVAPVWRKGKVEFDVLGPMSFDVVSGLPDQSCIEDAEAFIQFKAGKLIIWTAQEYTLGTEAPQFFEVADDEKRKILDSGVNPYQVPGKGWVYPFALLQYEEPDAELFIPGGEEITEAALHVAFTLTDNAFIERYQSFGQPVFTGMSQEAARQLVLSPSEAIALGQGQDLKFVSPGNAPAARMEALQNFLTIFAQSVSLPADVFIPNTLIPESGVAKRIASQALQDYWSAYAERLALAERKVFDTFRVVYNAHAAPADQIPWDIELKTKHAPIEPVFDALERDQRDEKQVEHNLTTWADVIARDRDVPRDQAVEILQRNRAENAATGPSVPGAAPGASGATAAATMAELRARIEARRAATAAAAAAQTPDVSPPNG